VLLDVQMPGLSGPELQDQLTKSGSLLHYFSEWARRHSHECARDQGRSRGLSGQPARKEVLQEAIERALRRYDEFYERNARINTQRQHAMQLTRRQREVFSRVVVGN
jgi:FixJ family two-component response regulator